MNYSRSLLSKLLLLSTLCLTAFSGYAQQCSYLIYETFRRGNVPTGWTQNSISTYNTGSAAGSGYIAFNGAGDHITTPLLTTPGTLTFDYTRSTATDAWSLKVQVSTNGTTWTDAQTGIATGVTTAWQTASINLSAYSNVYVRILDSRGSGTAGRFISNMVIPDRTGTVVTLCNNTNFTVACGTTYTFYDPGGLGDYKGGVTYTSTFSPSVTGNKVRMVFNSFVTESGTCANNYDVLKIYDGNSTSATLIGCYSTSGSIPGTITSTAADGTLTLVFQSDGATIGAGWNASVSCFSSCTAPTALSYTSNTIAYCGNTAITSNSPTFTGSAATSYSVSPSLPAGLSLNTTTGVITGTPTTPTAAANYTVTVNNGCGSTTKVLNIAVNSFANDPGAISLPVSACVGTAVTVTNVTAASTGTPASTGPTYYYYWTLASPVSWNMYESTTNTSSTLPTAVTNNPGNYTIARNSEFGCAAQTNNANVVKNITINAAPTAVITRTPTGPQYTGTAITFAAAPSGGATPYSYAWTATPPNASFAATPSTGSASTFTTVLTNSDVYSATPSGPVQVNCLVTDNNGCSVTSGLSPQIYPAIQAPQGITARCAGAGTTQMTTGTSMYTTSGTSGYSGFNWTISPSGAGSIDNTGLITWNSSFTGAATVSVNAIGAGSSAIVGTQNSGIKSSVINVGGYTAPTTVSGPTTLCHGGSTTLTASGGTAGSSIDIWYDGACSNAFEQNWDAQPYTGVSTTVNSNVNGILNVTSTTNDPMMYMTGLGSFDPVTNKYIHMRYRVLSGTAGAAEIFFLNGANPGANQSYAASGALISDGNWQVLNIDMSANANWTTGGNITGFRFDWAANNNVQMEIDFVTLSANKILQTGSSLTISPTSTKTYYVNRVGSCGSTSCISHTVTLPTAGLTLSGNESATCAVSGNNWIHFYNTSTNKLLVSINPNGNNLGNVTATSFVDGSSVLTQACNTGTDPAYTTAAMGRRWTITPEFQPSTPVSVRFPYGDAELASLVSASAGTASNPFDDVTSSANLKLSKYSGANQDGGWSNNCADGGTIIVLNQAGQGALTSANGFVNTIASSQYIQFSIPGFSEFWLHNTSSASPLPVELTSFSANCEGHEVKLNWTTASEQNSDKYIVEKSRNLNNWEPTGELAAAGQSNYQIDYALTDLDPLTGISYYRLIQKDMNGTEKSYGPISVSCADEDNHMLVFPNPASGDFTVEILSDIDLHATELQVVDLAGKIISAHSVNILEGKNQVSFEHNRFQSGTYIVKLVSNGEQFKPVILVIH